MRILLVNPPHPSIGSRIPREHLPPLGLLSIGGPLLDKGHDVRLLDAEFGPMKYADIVAETLKYEPSLVLLGHSGSTSAQPIISEITRLIRQKKKSIKIVIVGVFPTYHWREILEAEPQIDYIVCGEGEETIVKLVHALENGSSPELVQGLAYHHKGKIIKTTKTISGKLLKLNPTVKLSRYTKYYITLLQGAVSDFANNYNLNTKKYVYKFTTGRQ